MLTIVVVLVALWALGLFSGYLTDGPIHILLVVALIALVFRLTSGRRSARATQLGAGKPLPCGRQPTVSNDDFSSPSLHRGVS